MKLCFSTPRSDHYCKFGTANLGPQLQFFFLGGGGGGGGNMF